MATKAKEKKATKKKTTKSKSSSAKSSAPKKKKETKKTPAKNPSSFAVVETGGKQYRVQEGDLITVEKLEAKVGDKVTLDSVLLIDTGSKTEVGTPYLKGKKVTAEVVDAGRKKKITVIRFRAKSRHFKKKGHRQPYTTLKITKI